MKAHHIILMSVVLLTMASCSPKVTRSAQYPKMYEEKPTTILVMPPINNTTNAEAKDYFYSSLAMPLNNKGYYVVSTFMALNLLKQESAYDSELFVDGSLEPFKNVFGADAVLFTTINKWEKKAALSYINVDIKYTLKSAHTGEILWEREGDVKVSFSSGNNNGLLGMALDMLQTAMTDHVVVARRCNNFILQDMPEGKYSPNFGNDGNMPAGKAKITGSVKK